MTIEESKLGQTGKDLRGEIKVDPNVELQDYSGPFKPDLRFTDFSREALAKMYMHTCEYLLAVMEYYQTWVVEKLGMDAMLQLLNDVWGNEEFLQRLMASKKEFMGLSGNDIETLAKDFQMDATALPYRYYECTHEMPSQDRFIYTFRRCRGVDVLEPVDEELLGKTCHATCPPAITATALAYNPNIQVKILKIPPRTQQMKDDGICCQWEFTYKSK